MISGVGFRGLGLGCRVYDLGHGFRFFQGLGLRLCAPVGLRYLRLTLMHFPHLLYMFAGRSEKSYVRLFR